MNLRLTLVLGAAVLCTGGDALSQNAPPAENEPYVKKLSEVGIDSTAESIAAYLNSFHPDAAERKRREALVEQLGDADFFKREAATRELLMHPLPSTEIIARAAEGDDPEIRWRAGELLRIGTEQRNSVLYAVFQTVDAREIKGLADEVLATLPLVKEGYLRSAAREALVATARREDVTDVRKHAASSDPETAAASLFALEKLIGADADPDLVPRLEHESALVRFAAARALANHGDRASLHALVKLLDAKDLEMRVRASETLSSLTGHHVGYIPYEESPRRKEWIAAWNDWLEAEGRNAKLDFPLPELRMLLGRTVVCYYGKSRLAEVDAQGKEIWSVPATSPRGCHGLRNGHRLVASYSGRYVAEYDAKGKEVWRKNGLPSSPYSVRRLNDGNTLVACYTSRVVLEIAPDGSIAWQVTLPDKPKSARRLENGNTLLTLYSSSRVAEINRAGKIVWEVGGMVGPYSAERLRNGNTLVAQYSGRKVVEIDRGGRVVWSQENLTYPTDAQRLPNGNTMIVDRTGVREFTRDGRVVWSVTDANAKRAHRY